jgi:hypothetical protein
MDETMNEEFVSDPLPSIPRQHALLRKYCLGVEERIKTSGSASAASVMVGSICQQFSAECESHVLRSGLQTYLNELIRRYWGVV